MYQDRGFVYSPSIAHNQTQTKNRCDLKTKYNMQESLTSNETSFAVIYPEIPEDQLDELLNDVELYEEDLSEWLDQPGSDNNNNVSDSIDSVVYHDTLHESQICAEERNDIYVKDTIIFKRESESVHELLRTPVEIDEYPKDSSLSTDFGLEEVMDVGTNFESLDFPSEIFDGNGSALRGKKRRITGEFCGSTHQPRQKTAKKDISDWSCDSNDSLPIPAHTAICVSPDRVSRFEIGVSTKPSDESDEYKHAMRKLRASMERSEQSRSQVLRNRKFHSIHSGSVSKSTAPPLTTLQTLSDLFSGKRNCLTTGLEVSRRRLGRYLSMMSSNQLF